MTKLTQKIPTGYKNTEIGVIPVDWDVKRVIDFTDCTAGGTPSTLMPKYWGGDIPWMNSGELNDKKIFDVAGRITETGLKESSTKIVPKDCVLVGLAGQGKTRGTVAINRIDLCVNQSIAAIFPSKNHDSDFLYYNFDNRYDEIRGLSTGGEGRGGLNLSIIRQIPVAFPSKPEQSAIASALSDADALISKLEALIQKKKNIKQGAMQELLTGKRRLPGFSGEWEKKRMGEIGKPYGGLAGKIKSDFGAGNSSYIPFMNIMSNPVIDPSYLDVVNIRQGENQNTAQKGDLFFNGSSETPEEVGMCSVLLADIPNLYLNSFCFGFRLNKELGTDGLFFAYYFRSNEGRQCIFSLAQGATRYNLSKTNFLRLTVPYPKSEEQVAIASVLSDMDAEIRQLESQLSKYQNLKQGMMQVLLTGKIRLL